MATTTWEKSAASPAARSDRWQFLVGAALLLAAIGYLIISGTLAGARYFISVETLVTDSQYIGQTVRISGAVDGNTIQYDSSNLILDFTVAHINDQNDDLALELHTALNDSQRARVAVHLEGLVMPDLLQHEAQAIMTGRLGEDGVFYATELLLKCPSRYGETLPQQVEAGS